MSFAWHIEVFDKSGARVEILQPDVVSLSWSYEAVGGCGDCEIGLRREFDNYGAIDLDYRVEIWRDIDPYGKAQGDALPATLPMTLYGIEGAAELRYGGFIREIARIFDERESVRLRCSGFVRQCEYVMVPDTTYSGDVGGIARAIIDTFLLPGTQIKRSADLHLCQDLGILVSDLYFDTSAMEALSMLAEIGANAEWGVRADREIFFLPRSAAIKQPLILGDHVKYMEPSTRTDDLVNRVFLRGQNGLKATLTSGVFQNGFQKERRIFLPALENSAEAVLYGNAYFSRFGAAQSRGRLVLSAWEDQLEAVGPPLGKIRVIGGPMFVKAGAALPATLDFNLGGTVGAAFEEIFRLDSISYRPIDNGLVAEVALGERRSALSDLLRAIEFKLSNLIQKNSRGTGTGDINDQAVTTLGSFTSDVELDMTGAGEHIISQVTIAATGRPITISSSFFWVPNAGDITVDLRRNDLAAPLNSFVEPWNSSLPSLGAHTISIEDVDTPAAGSFTYTISSRAADQGRARNRRLILTEIKK